MATTGVALEFAKLRTAVEVESRLRGEAVTDLLVGSYADEDAIASRAARLGYDLGRPRDLLEIGLDGIEPGAGVGEQCRLMVAVRDHLASRNPSQNGVSSTSTRSSSGCAGSRSCWRSISRIPASSSTSRSP